MEKDRPAPSPPLPLKPQFTTLAFFFIFYIAFPVKERGRESHSFPRQDNNSVAPASKNFRFAKQFFKIIEIVDFNVLQIIDVQKKRNETSERLQNIGKR